MRCLFFLLASTLAVAFAFSLPGDVAILPAESTSQSSTVDSALTHEGAAREARAKEKATMAETPAWDGEIQVLTTCCASCEEAEHVESTKHTAMVGIAIEAQRAEFRGEAVK